MGSGPSERSRRILTPASAATGSINIRNTLSLRHVAFLSLALVAFRGCHWGDRHAKPEELPVLPGLSVLEFDGLYVQLKRDSSDGSGLFLVVAGQAVERAGLRQGEQFLLTDGHEVYQTYRVLLVDPERITLRRRTTFDHRASGEGIRDVEDVVALKPYNLERTK